ncbi:2-C-methyl-D-erythritol 2,4-cyclodiphosphate synthase [Homoserinimonas aerilata]|uniref:Bifunctional enzyme IspD/IspF n=1 Tax=Homoserinimonas aerilata TaxID=1162970 RepID=A0A542YG39_9MICO|nr:2-C-methyl-D-erythritol 4-phosphate cytidylyltransferase [Homoserinimonas aerilata]TQL47039.1 2-C-methyl-D-erythritol 2,4-cyclodiphosphate synthase [Homoserinimonas aerilata]
MQSPSVAVVVVAAGSGARLGRAEPKAFVPLAGRPLLAHALDSVFGMGEGLDGGRSVQLVVVAPASRLDEARAIVEDAAGVASDRVSVVVGGATRQLSVAAGLAAVAPGTGTVLIHDAARALTPSALFDAVVAAVESTAGGVIPGLPVADTIKRVDASGAVLQTVDRSELAAVQTPQGFPLPELLAAYEAATEEFTDDAALFAAAGHPVSTVEGDALAFKVTTSWDLRRAEQLLGGSAQPTLRTGIGVDVHAFDDASPLWLGGLYWPDEPGLSGHSDGDVLSHAVCDALLSAAGLGDIGGRFGTSDDRFAGAHGDVFLSETARLVAGAGFTVVNVAVQLVANHPKLAARRVEIEQRLGALLGAPVSVSATTADGLGFTGRGEGITAIATALLQAS